MGREDLISGAHGFLPTPWKLNSQGLETVCLWIRIMFLAAK